MEPVRTIAHRSSRRARRRHVAFQVFLDGIVAAVRSVFFYVLVGNYVGLGALAHEVGFSFWWMALSTVLIWAAPAQVILVSTLTTAALFEVALAVTLSSVRFLPMVAAILPIMRRAGRAPARSAAADASDRDQRLGRGHAAVAADAGRAPHRLLQRAWHRPDVRAR